MGNDNRRFDNKNEFKPTIGSTSIASEMSGNFHDKTEVKNTGINFKNAN